MPHFECGAFDHSATSPAVAPSVGTILKVSRRVGRRASGRCGFKSTEALVGALRARRSLIKAGAACTRAPRHDFHLGGPFRAREQLRGPLLRLRAKERRRSSRCCAMAGCARRLAAQLPAMSLRPSRISRVQGTSCGVRCRTTRRPLRGNGGLRGEPRSAHSRQVRVAATGCRANRSGSFGQTTPGRGASSVSSAVRRSHAAASCWR